MNKNKTMETKDQILDFINKVKANPFHMKYVDKDRKDNSVNELICIDKDINLYLKLTYMGHFENLRIGDSHKGKFAPMIYIILFDQEPSNLPIGSSQGWHFIERDILNYDEVYDIVINYKNRREFKMDVMISDHESLKETITFNLDDTVVLKQFDLEMETLVTFEITMEQFRNLLDHLMIIAKVDLFLNELPERE